MDKEMSSSGKQIADKCTLLPCSNPRYPHWWL